MEKEEKYGRTRLTIEQAYDLVRHYVTSLWSQYSSQFDSMQSKEDTVQDMMVKLTRPHKNRDYNPDFQPGDDLLYTAGRSDNSPKRTVSTQYMLSPGYNPENPYDPNYFIPKMKEYNYLDKYSGHTTSKPYYIMSMVKTLFIDLTRKKTHNKYTVDMDKPIGDSENSRSIGDTIPDTQDNPQDYTLHKIAARELKTMLTNAIASLSAEPLSPRIVGWSPLTGEVDSNGNHIESHLTARDIGIFVLNGFTPEDVSKLYHDSQNGKPVSASTISKYWKSSMEAVRKACLQDETLKKSGYLDGIK